MVIFKLKRIKAEIKFQYAIGLHGIRVENRKHQLEY